MKQILSILTACFFLVFVSCNNEGEKTAGETKGDAMSSMAQKNLAASHTVIDAFKTGDVSKIDSVIADNFIDHTERGDMGRDSLKAAIKMMQAMNMKAEILSEAATDDYVYTRMRFTGVSDGSMMPPGPYDMHEMHVVRCKDGKAV